MFPSIQNVGDLFYKYDNASLLKLKLVKWTSSQENFKKAANTLYAKSYGKTEFYLNIFKPENEFIIDALYSLYDIEARFKLDDIHYRKIKTLKKGTQEKTIIELEIRLDEYTRSPRRSSSRRSKTVPISNDLGRELVSKVKYLSFTAEFEVIGKLHGSVYQPTTIHDYYDEMLTAVENAELDYQGGAFASNVSAKKARGLDALKKQDLIDRCRAKKIPYSGRTKAELVAALRR